MCNTYIIILYTLGNNIASLFFVSAAFIMLYVNRQRKYIHCALIKYILFIIHSTFSCLMLTEIWPQKWTPTGVKNNVYE